MVCIATRAFSRQRRVELQFRRKCGELAPELGRERKTSSRPSRWTSTTRTRAFTEQAVTEDLHSILDELKDLLKPKELSRYTDELM